MGLHSTPTKIGLSIALFFSLCGWVIYLGGLGKTTNMCDDGQYGVWNTPNDSAKLTVLGYEDILKYPFPIARFANQNFESAAYACGVHFSLEWWIWAYQFILIIAGFVCTWASPLFNQHIVLHLFAISTTLFTISTSMFLKYGYRYVNDADLEQGHGPNTCAAGGILLIISNYVFAWVYGTEPAEADDSAKA